MDESDRTFRGFEPDQSFLLSPNPREWLPKGHLAFFVQDVVVKLDLRPIFKNYEVEAGGAPPFHPRMMTAVLLYAYARGVRSTRVMERLVHEDLGFRYLAAQNKPDHTSFARFRKRHLGELEKLFTQVLRMCQEAGLVRLGHVAIDGTKLRANASKRKAMTLKRLRENEATLRAEVHKYFEECDETDEREEAEGRDESDWRMPPEMHEKQARLKRIQDALQQLEEREQKDIEENPSRREKEPRENAQHNFTDPDSRIMPDNGNTGAFVQAYNAQFAVDKHAQVIIAYDLIQNPIDNPTLPATLAIIEENVGRLPDEASLDAGYCSDGNLALLDDLGVDAFVSTSKHKRDRIDEQAPRGRTPARLSLVERMRRKLTTKRGKRKYALRKQIVEPVIGQIKEGQGYRRSSLRGYENTRGELGIVATVHNMLKLFRATAA